MDVAIPVLMCQGDARHIPLPDESVQCCVTSPPYWGLRSYGIGAENGELGLEPTPELYCEHLVEVFREVRRVLRSDGCVWLNLGDSYASSGKSEYMVSPKSTLDHGFGLARNPKARANPTGRAPTPPGLKPKDLVGIPWRVAFALQADGWWLRSDASWPKKNPMPGSQQDRPTVGHEYLFLLSKSARYYYDGESVKVEGTGRASGNVQRLVATEGERGRLNTHMGSSIPYEPNGTGRTRRTTDWWFEGLDELIAQQRAYLSHLEHVRDNGGALLDEMGMIQAIQVNTQPFSGSHFATFPPALVEPCIKAGTSERGACPECGAPWERVVEKTGAIKNQDYGSEKRSAMQRGGISSTTLNGTPGTSVTLGWRPGCACDAGDPVPCLCLDPFGGSGTVGLVAMQLGRRAVMIDLNAEYCASIAWPRLHPGISPFVEVERLESLPMFAK